MRNIIPYEKEIEFDTKIAEITSISLEHEERNENGEITGDFIITGDYKIHQISVNKEKFKYKIPFTIELTDEIDKNTIELDINDFTYDIKDDNKLVVKIELLFNYEEKEQKDIDVLDDIEDAQIIEDRQENADEELNKEIDNIINDTNDNTEIKKNIIENNVNSENTYITYHVYVVNKEDTIEGICDKFKVNNDILHEYNDFEEIKYGDKLLIPIDENE